MICGNCLQEFDTGSNCNHCGFLAISEVDVRVLREGTTLKNSRYLVGRLIGKGGFGLTYRAFDREKFKALVVLKECMVISGSDEVRAKDGRTILIKGMSEEKYKASLRAFYQEATTIARLSHPNIVRIVDFFYENNTAYYVMPLVEGVDMRSYLLESGGRITEAEILPISVKLSYALEEMHSAGIVHGDVKPQNIILSQHSREPILIDFGCARDLRRPAGPTIRTFTESYSPIEQQFANGQVGPWTDVYALSATMYRSLTGQPPPDPRAHVGGSSSWAAVTNPSQLVRASKEIGRAIQEGLTRDFSARPKSMQEFRRLLPGIPVDADTNTKTTGGGEHHNRSRIPQPSRADGARIQSPTRSWVIWFLPSMLALMAAGVADDAVQYIAFGFLPILVVNFVAWALLVRRVPIVRNSEKTNYMSNSDGPAKRGVVFFLDGPLAGKSFFLRGGQELTIGRSAPADIIVNNNRVSRLHARISFSGDAFNVIDLGSTNGTYRIAGGKNDVNELRKMNEYSGDGIFQLGAGAGDRIRFECTIE